MDIKPRTNHWLYLKILRRMTLEERLTEALELSQLSREFIKASREMPQSELVKGAAR